MVLEWSTWSRYISERRRSCATVIHNKNDIRENDSVRDECGEFNCRGKKCFSERETN